MLTQQAKYLKQLKQESKKTRVKKEVKQPQPQQAETTVDANEELNQEQE